MNGRTPTPVQRLLDRLWPAPPPAAVSSTPLPPLSASQASELDQLAEEANTTLETAASEASSRAFNLGCLTGLLPAALLLILMSVFIGWSLIGIFMALVLTVISMIAFANLAAAVARVNTVRRAYHEDVQPHVARSLDRSGLLPGHFSQAAHRLLPPTAPLLAFLEPPPALPDAGPDPG